VFGYELLQRVAHDELWDADDDLVTLQVIRKAVLEFGLNALAGSRHLFLNVGIRCLKDQEYLVFPAERTVLEVLERVEVDRDLVKQIRTARDLGYRIALDDYVGDPRFDPVLAHVDIVKLEVLDRSEAELLGALERLAVHAPQAKLLAEKVESEDIFNGLRQWPIELFQGYFFKRPTTLETLATVPTHQAALLRVAAALQSSDVEFDHLAALVSGVPKLAFQLLRLANSASLGLARKMATLHEAMVALGLAQLRKIVHILLVTSATAGPPEIGTLGLIRARVCARLAAADGADEDAAFTVGLFSLMDVALRMPLTDILQAVKLRPDVEDALLNDNGRLSAYLRMARAVEDTNDTSDPGELRADACAMFLEAVAWAETLTSELL
jgi:EAL and modified HD-GYP domain-containing signal transduction protein